MDRIGTMSELAARSARPFQYRTFAVGVTLPDGLQEREDELRSELKLKGNETIKTQAARLIGATLAEATKKRLDKQRPDLALLVDFASGNVLPSSRPLFFHARYTKPVGVAQREVLCEHCRGAGCKKCKNTGIDQKPSVEEVLRRKLASLVGSEKVIITWLGSEDRESRVYPPGRPFVAEVKSPRKRILPKKFGARVRGGLVSISSGRVLPSKPVRLPAFRFVTKIKATARSKVNSQGLADLRRAFHGAAVKFERPHNRPVMKTVYKASATAKGRTLFIEAELDGGLPVKRFVNGDLVSPSVSEVLKTEVGCRSFDIFRVREIGEFVFAEITRGEEKN